MLILTGGALAGGAATAGIAQVIAKMMIGGVDQNPLVWMAEVNGLLVDIRAMPREVQVIAYEKGLMPYIPVGQ
jgi:hypothetical protein